MKWLTRRSSRVLFLILVLIALSACGGDTSVDTGPTDDQAREPATTTAGQATDSDSENANEETTTRNEQLHVVASTSIVGDVVRNVAGDAANVTVLMPIGMDSHSFEPTPQDAATMANADVIFINGLGLEETLHSMLEQLGNEEKSVELAAAVEPIESQGEHEREDDEPANGEEHDNGHGSEDPHVWMNPNNVITWTEVIAQRLSELDPDHAEIYAANADAYRAELEELDAWIRAKVAQVPEDNHKLVTDHMVFGHFAEQYGFEQIGSVFPGTSTVSEPSAKQIAELQDLIGEHNVPAIFVGTTVNPQFAEQLAADMGVTVRQIYTDSLSDADGPASTYIEFMRYNVSTITDALKPE